MSAKHETAIVRDLSEVPAGYERLSWFANRVPGKNPKTVTKFLSDSHGSGRLPAAKVVRCYGDLKTGAVYLDKAKAVAGLQEHFGVTVVQDDGRTTLPDSSAKELRELTLEVREAVHSVQRLAAELRAAVELLSERACEPRDAKECFNGVA
jgi:hypothetical protein